MRLNRTQYAHYKLNVEEIMDRYNWANIANGVELRPGSSSSTQISLPANSRNSVATQLRDWDRRDNSLKEFLLLSLPTEWKSTFINVEGGGHELWQAIVHEFERETPDDHTQLMAALYNIIQGTNETLDSFVERLQTITHQMEELGETVSTNTKVMCFFKGLNIIYKPEDVNILLEQQLSLEQAAQLVAEFAECKRDAFVRSHSRSNPPAVEVTNLVDLSGTPTSSSTPSTDVHTAPVPPVRTARNKVGVLIDVNSPPTTSSTDTATSPSNSAYRPYPAVPVIAASPTSSTSSTSTPSAAQHRTAFEVTSLHRGLKNETGENNCFLNVTIQALWHLGPFRAHLTAYIHERQQQGANTKGKSAQSKGAAAVGLLDALCNLFVQYEFSDQAALPPTELRQCLMAVSANFKLGEIADANEALDAILQRIHAEQSTICPHTHKCLSHEVFGGNIMEQTICSRCGASSEPTMRSDFILTFQAAELLLEAKALFAKFSHFEGEETSIHPTENHTIAGRMQHFNPVGGLSRFLGCARRHAYRNNPENSPVKRGTTVNSAIHETESPHHYGNTEFGHILSKCMMLHQRSCPSLEFGNSSPPLQSRVALLDRQGSQGAKKLFALDGCGGRASVLQYSLDPPLAVALSIGWTSSKESPATLQDFFDIVAYTIKLSDLFQVHGASSSSVASAEHSSENSEEHHSTAGGKYADQHPHQYTKKDTRAQSPTVEDWISPEVSENNPSYVFRGLVCYYGKHYVSIFQGIDGGHDNFLLFDDHTIKTIGDWNAVKAKCVKSHYQPVLLLYELEKLKK